MRMLIVLFYFVVANTILSAQTGSDKYNLLLSKADRFYRLKNYNASATAYSQAFKIGKNKIDNGVRYNAACSWALANNPDSALAQLKLISKNNFSSFELLSDEKDLISLHSIKEWKHILSQVKLNYDARVAKQDNKLMKILDSILVEDQQDRSKISEIEAHHGSSSREVDELWKTIIRKDSLNLIIVEKILDTRGWLGSDVVGEQGNSTLFLVIQHSDLKTQEKYLPMMKDAVAKGNARAADLALLEDRIAIYNGRKQIYGSQIIRDPVTGKDTMAPIEDFENVNKRRSAAGLEPLEEYVKNWGIELKKNDQKKNKKTINLKSVGNDFNLAEEIHDSIVGPVNVTPGLGKRLDFNLGWGLEEHNSAWFKFTIDKDTILTFDIVPVYPRADYDFILFKCQNSECLEDFLSYKIKSDRYCFSINHDKNSSTGLSEYYSDKYLLGGPGSGYVSSLNIKAGDTYYLVVDWPYKTISHGFTIYFYNYWPDKPDELKIKRTFPVKKQTQQPAPIVVENISFESNSAILLKESYANLNKLAIKLQTDKSMRILIQGHTDKSGDEVKNQKLSEARAKAVVDYLVSKKVDPKRLSYKGFGSSLPVANNLSEEGKKKNRRVEFIPNP